MINAATCAKKAALAKRNQLWCCAVCTLPEEIKNAIVASKEATKANITKKWPSWPGNKCSPIKFITGMLSWWLVSGGFFYAFLKLLFIVFVFAWAFQ